jgi:hypothetical protein
MRRPAGALAAVLLALAPLLWAAAAAAPAAATAAATDVAGVAGVTVAVDRTRVDTAIGGRFVLHTTLSNGGDQASGPLAAHLDVVSLTPDVYVDPEDWSPERTQWVGSLAPGRQRQLSWQLQAVNEGSFDVYVVLLPTQGADPPSAVLTVSPAVRLGVVGRQTISAGGVLPVVVAVPSLLTVLVVVRSRWRRHHSVT